MTKTPDFQCIGLGHCNFPVTLGGKGFRVFLKPGDFLSPNFDDLVKSHEWKLPAASCRESSTVRNISHFLIRSLTPQQAAGNALAVAVQL